MWYKCLSSEERLGCETDYILDMTYLPNEVYSTDFLSLFDWGHLFFCCVGMSVLWLLSKIFSLFFLIFGFCKNRFDQKILDIKREIQLSNS